MCHDCLPGSAAATAPQQQPSAHRDREVDVSAEEAAYKADQCGCTVEQWHAVRRAADRAGVELRQQDAELVAKLARFDGREQTTECQCCGGTGYTGSELDHEWCMKCDATGKVAPRYANLPDYLNDSNAARLLVLRLAPKYTGDVEHLFVKTLLDQIYSGKHAFAYIPFAVAAAEPRQICVAVAAAMRL